MPEQHTQVLKELGVPDDKIAALEVLTPDQLKDFKAADYTTPALQTIKGKLLNDADFLKSIPEEKLSDLAKKIESGQYTRFQKELAEVATELGIDVATLPEETKKSIKGLFRETNKQYLAKHGTGENKAAVQELQTKLQESLKNYDDLTKGQQKALDEALAKQSGTITQKMEKLVVQSKVGAVKELNTKPEYVAETAHNKVKAQYLVVFDTDAMEFKLMQKANPQLDVLKSDGSILSYDEALIAVLDKDGLINKKKDDEDDKGKGKGKQPVKVTVDGDETKPAVASYITDKMKAALDAEAAEAGKRK